MYTCSMSLHTLSNPAALQADQFDNTQVPRSKKQIQGAETRRALLAAARKVFARDGFQACRLEDIAKEAGFTRGAFYFHFKTKEDLFFSLMELEAEKHRKNVTALLSTYDGMESRLEALRQYYVASMAEQEWSLLLLEYKLYAARHASIRSKLVEQHRHVEEVTKIDRPDGFDFLSTEDGFLSATLEAFGAGILLEQIYRPERLPEVRAADILGKVFDMLISENRKSGISESK